ncbi:MAG: cyclic nucleotide-binding domain-containing protein [Cyanobacteria bacterium P01_A01_bin.123]
MTAISSLEDDIYSYGIHLKSPEWNEIKSRISEFEFVKKSVIFSQALICDKVFFVTDGIAASEQTLAEGVSPIARFFSRGQFCSNITSALIQEYANDTLIAITDVNSVSMPMEFFLKEYHKGKAFGEYLRKKVLETLLFDKEVMCAKTTLNTEYRYRFLEERQQDVIHRVSDKDIARFIGITPQGLCRFLKHRRGNS